MINEDRISKGFNILKAFNKTLKILTKDVKQELNYEFDAIELDFANKTHSKEILIARCCELVAWYDKQTKNTHQQYKYIEQKTDKNIANEDDQHLSEIVTEKPVDLVCKYYTQKQSWQEYTNIDKSIYDDICLDQSYKKAYKTIFKILEIDNAKIYGYFSTRRSVEADFDLNNILNLITKQTQDITSSKTKKFDECIINLLKYLKDNRPLEEKNDKVVIKLANSNINNPTFQLIAATHFFAKFRDSVAEDYFNKAIKAGPYNIRHELMISRFAKDSGYRKQAMFYNQNVVRHLLNGSTGLVSDFATQRVDLLALNRDYESASKLVGSEVASTYPKRSLLHAKFESKNAKYNRNIDFNI